MAQNEASQWIERVVREYRSLWNRVHGEGESAEAALRLEQWLDRFGVGVDDPSRFVLFPDWAGGPWVVLIGGEGVKTIRVLPGTEQGENRRPPTLEARYLPPLIGGTYTEHFWAHEDSWFLAYTFEHPVLDGPLTEQFRTARQIDPQRDYREMLSKWAATPGE